MPEREVTIDVRLKAGDSSLRETLIDVLRNYRPHGSATVEFHELADEFMRRLFAPEPAEPPPGVYRDNAGAAWQHTTQGWYIAGDPNRVYWADMHVYQPLAPLFTAAELIPDPDDMAAVDEFCIFAALGKTPHRATVQIVLAALRARAESRAGAPEASDGN